MSHKIMSFKFSSALAFSVPEIDAIILMMSLCEGEKKLFWKMSTGNLHTIVAVAYERNLTQSEDTLRYFLVVREIRGKL